jgi:hypothetical protein
MRIRINASDAIRSLVDEIAVPEGVRPDVDGVGDACAQDSERRDPPPREQLTAKARAKEPMALTKRHVMEEVDGKVLSDLAGTVAFLGFYVGEVLGVGSGNRRIFHIVNRALSFSGFLAAVVGWRLGQAGELAVNRAGPSANPDAGRTPHRDGEVRDLKVPRRMSSSVRALHRWSPVMAAAGHPHDSAPGWVFSKPEIGA